MGEVVLAYYNKSGWRAAVIETNLKFNNRSRKNECKVRFLGDGSIVYTKSLDQLFVVQKNIKKKKAKPTHVSAGLNRLYVSVFDYGVTAIIN